MVKLDIFLIETAFSGHTSKNSAYPLFGAWAFLVVHIRFTLIEGPKGFVNIFVKKSDYEVGPWKNAIFHGLTS